MLLISDVFGLFKLFKYSNVKMLQNACFMFYESTHTHIHTHTHAQSVPNSMSYHLAKCKEEATQFRSICIVDDHNMILSEAQFKSMHMYLDGTWTFDH